MTKTTLFELEWALDDGVWRAVVVAGSMQRLIAPPLQNSLPLLDALRDGVAYPGLRVSAPVAAIHVAALGGLISNLRVWENIVLPLWYQQALTPTVEAQVLNVLAAMGEPAQEAALWLHRPSATLDRHERCLASVLRALVAPAPLILLDAACLEDLGKTRRRRWLQVLHDELARPGRAVLCFCSTDEWPEVLAAELPGLDWMGVHETIAG